MQWAMEDMLDSFIEKKLGKVLVLLKKTTQGFERLSPHRCVRLQELMRKLEEIHDRPYTRGLERYFILFEHLRVIQRDILSKLYEKCCINTTKDARECLVLVKKLKEKQKEIWHLYEVTLGIEWVPEQVVQAESTETL